MLFQPKEKTKLDLEIDQLTTALKDHPVTSKEYAKIVKRMTELNKIRSEENKKPERELLSPNSLLAAAASILGIILITRYEKENVVTSKSLGFIPRTK
jgi:hypothetical protein